MARPAASQPKAAASKRKGKMKRKRCLDGLDMPAQLETLLNHYEVVDLIACTLVKCKLALSHDALTRQVGGGAGVRRAEGDWQRGDERRSACRRRYATLNTTHITFR